MEKDLEETDREQAWERKNDSGLNQCIAGMWF